MAKLQSKYYELGCYYWHKIFVLLWRLPKSSADSTIVPINLKSVQTESSSMSSVDNENFSPPVRWFKGTGGRGRTRRGEESVMGKWAEKGTKVGRGSLRTCRPWSTFQRDSSDKNSELAATRDNLPNDHNLAKVLCLVSIVSDLVQVSCVSTAYSCVGDP